MSDDIKQLKDAEQAQAEATATGRRNKDDKMSPPSAVWAMPGASIAVVAT